MVNPSAASATKSSQQLTANSQQLTANSQQPVSQRFPQPLRQRLRIDEVVERLVVGGEDVVAAAAPGKVSLVDERDGFADGDDGVQIVGVDDCRGVEFMGDLGDELVDEQRGFGVQTRVGLVEEEVLGVAGKGTGDGGTLLHTTT